MDKRHHDLKKLKEFNNNIHKEITLLLQNLQWDHKLITEKRSMVTCKYDSNHKIPVEGRDAHEQQCQLTKLGYDKYDSFLPDTVDPDASTLVTFSKHKIIEIINNAAINDPSFKRVCESSFWAREIIFVSFTHYIIQVTLNCSKLQIVSKTISTAEIVIVSLTQGVGCEGPEPLTVERLQRVYTADERRAIHDAVVSTAPFCHDLTDLDLLSSNNGAKESQKKSRLEILVELRNMKRRRAKYRVAPKTRNYSDVLRDVIKTQMDTYGEATRTIIKTEYGPNVYVSQKVTNTTLEYVPHDTVIKQEQESPEFHNRYQRQEFRDSYRGRSKDKRLNNDRNVLRKDYSNTERNKTKLYARNETSKDMSAEKNREYSRDGRWHRKDEYSSKERSRNYDGHREYDYGKSRERRYYDDDRRYLDYSSRDSSKGYGCGIKQERASQESETYDNSSKDSIREHNNSKYKDGSENEYSKNFRNDKHRKRHSPDKYNERERKLSPIDSYRSGETSRKRHRSRSKEKRHKDKKKRLNKDKHSSKRDKNHDSLKIGHDNLSDTIIKQERESP